MNKTQQQTIFGEPLDEQIHIETAGRIIRPFKRMLDQVAGEYRLEFTNDGVVVGTVDSGNVLGIEIELYASAFDVYELAGITELGITASNFGSAVQHARYAKNTDDEIAISADSKHLETEVSRELGSTAATLSERVGLIDPASIRERPDLPELDLGVSVDVPVDTFIEVLNVLDTDNEHIKLGSNIDSVTFNQETDTQQRNIRIDANPTEASEYTYFTAEYLSAIASGLNVGYVDDVTLRWDEEMPLFVDFEREGVYEGQFMVAPRIMPD